MSKYKIDGADLAMILIGIVLVVMMFMQLMEARNMLEQSRSECYAQIGREACESVR